MNQTSIHEIAKALSDELRVEILRELASKPPMRHTDLLSYLGLNGYESNRFSYHLGILVDSGLISKREYVYTITDRGREILEDLTVTIEDWEELAYRDDLRQLTGLEIASVIWSSESIGGLVAFSLVVITLFVFTRNPVFLTIIPLTLIGILFSYWNKPNTGIENQKLAVKHIKRILGENTMMPSLIPECGLGGLTFLYLFLFFSEIQDVSFGLNHFTIILFFAMYFGLSIWLTGRFVTVWDDISASRTPVNYRSGLLIISTIMIIINLVVGIGIFSAIFAKNTLAMFSGLTAPLLHQSWRIFKESFVEK